jgi:hypothetical protein
MMIEPSRSLRAAFALLLAVLLAAPHALAKEATANDTARILAGLEPSPGSLLGAIAAESGWKRHAKFFDDAWGKLDRRQLSHIRSWSAGNLTSPSPVLFYMFSGPDFLYADAFFPKASTYVLSGLEPVGRVPDLQSFTSRALHGELADLRGSLNSVLNYSFFITHNMKQQLKGGRITGTLPILYVFLARSGKTINEVSFVDIGKDGAIEPHDEAAKSPAKGVKIAFTDQAGAAHILYYFSTDLSNGGAKNEGFLKFCETLGTGDGFIKSASYLLHSDNFSSVRDFLLTHTATLVQDDSGIPVRFFKPDEWQLQPFGRYLGPISIFANRYQRKLAELFRKDRAGPLDFGVGYRWRPHESNLLLVSKHH